MKPSSRVLLMSGFLIVVTCIGLSGSSAQAHERGYGREHEWRQGHWTHDRHLGRLGWWWVAGPHWHFYERPHTVVIEQESPRTVIVQQPPAAVVQQQPITPPPSVTVTPVIYYCKATGTNYPETMTCPGGWSKMTAETPPEP